MSSAPDTSSPRRGLGRGLEVLVGGAGADGDLLHLPVDAIHPNARQPRRRFEPEATSGLAASLRHQGVLQPIVVRPRPEGGYELVAGRAPLARCARGRARDAAGPRPRGRRPRRPAARARRERRPREPLPRGGGARVRDARRRVRALARRGRGARRSLQTGRLQQAAPARAARGGALDARARRPHRRPRARGARGLGRRGADPPGPACRAGRAHRRATERAARDGGARRRPRATPVDPALAERARAAAERLTGLPARVAAGKLELHFGDETRLAELVEALESL